MSTGLFPISLVSTCTELARGAFLSFGHSFPLILLLLTFDYYHPTPFDMDYTLDDTAPQLVYSPDGWLIQSSNDTSRSLFFNGTYHAAQADGATVNVTVVGSSSISIYGSTGPGHVRLISLILSAHIDHSTE